MQKMSEKDKITIDEIIEHCNKTCEMAEMYAIKQGKTQDDITAKSYWEHYQVLKYIEELKQYRAIGTLDECREAVERMKPKKVKKIQIPNTSWSKACTRFECPSCNKYLNYMELSHCGLCGQCLDWSE